MLCEENADIINIKLHILILSCTYAYLLHCSLTCRFYKYSFMSISKTIRLSKTGNINSHPSILALDLQHCSLYIKQAL